MKREIVLGQSIAEAVDGHDFLIRVVPASYSTDELPCEYYCRMDIDQARKLADFIRAALED